MVASPSPPVTVVNNPFEKPKTMLEIQIEDRPGSLLDALEIFKKHDVNMTRIDSKPTATSFYNYAFDIDFEGLPTDPNVEHMLNELRMECLKIEIPAAHMVPWFPQRVRDLDFTVDTLDGG
jgi:prephenate dehydratase